MAVDATGTATSPDAIPTFNTAADNPSGKGTNNMVAAIQTALSARASKPSGIVSGEVPVWNGTAWVRSSVTNVAPTSLGSGTPDATKFLRGDGSWQVPSAFAGAQAHGSVAQAIATGTNSLIPFDTIDINASGYTLNAGRIVVPNAGKYRVTFFISWPTNGTGTRELVPHFYNSSGVDQGYFTVDDRLATSGSPMGTSVTFTTSNIAASTMLGLIVFQTSGSTLTIPGTAVSLCWNQQVWVEYLGA